MEVVEESSSVTLHAQALQRAMQDRLHKALGDLADATAAGALEQERQRYRRWRVHC